MTETSAPSRTLQPSVAWALGLAGLVPFFGAAAALWVGPETLRGAALLSLQAYAAAILSFLGGARWGLEVGRDAGPRPVSLAFSVLPALAAWLLLVGNLKISPALQLAGFGACLLAAGVWDARAAAAPAWYRRLRVLLTAGAVVALAIGYVAARKLG